MSNETYEKDYADRIQLTTNGLTESPSHKSVKENRFTTLNSVQSSAIK